MNISLKKTVVAMSGAMLAGAVGTAAAHGLDDVGAPACLEANFMLADAMGSLPGGQSVGGIPTDDGNGGYTLNDGPGQVLEVSIVTGKRGITVSNPFTSDPDSPVCGGDGSLGSGSDDISCQGDNGKSPFKPTGVLSGGLNGHAFITSAGQQALTEFHRDGTPVRSISYKPILGNPTGNAGLGTLPRPLGTQMMPNGNIIQAICDANFFNAQNSDREAGYTDPTGADPGNISYKYFPPVYSTPARAQNSRLLVMDQESLEVVDEYSYPHGDAREQLWGCMAGIAFTGEGMGVSMFHTAAIAMVDWKDGIEEGRSTGVGSNSAEGKGKGKGFSIGDDENQAVVTRWIDMRPGESDTDPSRRDSLRAWGLDEDGTIYVTDRERSKDCLEGELGPQGCHPGVFRQKVQVVDLGNSEPDRTIGLDPGVNVIAGIRPNRMSAVACANIGGPNANGEGTSCDVETLLIAASAFNPGCAVTGVAPPAPCFTFEATGHPNNPGGGGGVGEYSIDPDDADGVSGSCTGGQSGAEQANGDNVGCAQPIATFLGRGATGSNGQIDPANDFVDPRMLMVIHEAFVQ